MKLISKIKKDFPDIKFITGKKFAFRFPRTIIIGLEESDSDLLLLHELSHAILGHKDFTTDIERLRMETEAWEKVKELAKNYKVEFKEEVAQGELDTYRNWLHKKSRCPKCGLTRFQTPDSFYHCPKCENLG